MCHTETRCHEGRWDGEEFMVFLQETKDIGSLVKHVSSTEIEGIVNGILRIIFPVLLDNK